MKYEISNGKLVKNEDGAIVDLSPSEIEMLKFLAKEYEFKHNLTELRFGKMSFPKRYAVEQTSGAAFKQLTEMRKGPSIMFWEHAEFVKPLIDMLEEARIWIEGSLDCEKHPWDHDQAEAAQYLVDLIKWRCSQITDKYFSEENDAFKTWS